MPLYGDGQSVRSLLRKVRYERFLGGIIQPLESVPCFDWLEDPGKLVGVSRPYDQIYFSLNWGYWSRAVDLEYYMRIHSCAVFL